MPFMFHREVAKIDRSCRRDDKYIHKNIVKALESICKYDSGYVEIMPTTYYDPPFDKADPNKFLVLFSTKILDLSLYEVEYWLDRMPVSDDKHTFSVNKFSLVYVDERRKYYKSDYYCISHICFKTLK